MCVEVKDRGIGIPNDKLDLIFERFGQVDNSFTRQTDGTGIGLSIVKMFVELNGGEISCESTEGVGSTFTVLLPTDKVKYTPIEQTVKHASDKRLIKATTIEFSDIYLQ
jgi:two-component system sensor histidine kinase/response regulator